MKELRTSDDPINDPDMDLLGMAEYAQVLADFIRTVPPPFTIGISGGWGDGKSSYVELTHYYLNEKDLLPNNTKQKVIFIPFSAWPFTNSDELWRALILEISRVLYNVPSGYPPLMPVDRPITPKRKGLFFAISELLSQDALVLDQAPNPPPPFPEYDALLNRLDQRLYTRVERHPEPQAEFNQQATLLALINGTLAALGAISPLIAGLRSFLGLEDKVKPVDLLQQQRNEFTRQTIQSVMDFRQEFQRLFTTRAGGQRVCIFIDDLDRCLPNVALDLLEAIKIFLGHIECVFIVAADQQLIGQGLRLRYRDLYESGKAEEVEKYLIDKGQQYLEKIIQLGIRVPPRSADQTHAFISAQFPLWIPATDFIQLAIGSNPRRIKQFCNRLSFDYSVMDRRFQINAQVTRINKDQRRLLEKLITIQAWNHDCKSNLCSLAQLPVNLFHQHLSQLESLLQQAEADQQENESVVAALRENPISLNLYQLVVKTKPLLELFKKEPFLSEQEPLNLQILIRLAAVIPHPATAVRVEDPTFMRILDNWISKGLPVSSDTVLREDFLKILKIHCNNPLVMQMLYEAVSQTPETASTQLITLEQSLQQVLEVSNYPKGDVQLPKTVELSKPFQDLGRIILDNYNTDNKSLLVSWLEPPVFSTMPDTLMLYPKVVEILESLGLQPEMVTSRDEYQIAVKVYSTISRDDIASTAERLALRINVAEYYMELRKFAKLHTFTQRWPSYADLLYSNFGILKNIDSKFYQSDFELTQYEQEVWEQLKRDKSLVSFMGIMPHFWSITPADMQNYLAITSTSLPTTISVPGEVIAPQFDAPLVKDVPIKEVEFLNLELVFSDFTEIGCRLLLRSSTSDVLISRTVSVNWKELLHNIERLRVSASSTTRGPMPIDERSIATPDALREIGKLLYQTFFTTSNIGEQLEKYISKGNVRLGFSFEHETPLLHKIPWEALYINVYRLHPALSQKYSVIRLVDVPSVYAKPRKLDQPLRILAVLANPAHSVPINIEAEASVLQKALSKAQESGLVKLKMLFHTSPAEFLHELRYFRPHICHIVSHANFDPERNTGVIVLEGQEGQTAYLDSSQLTSLLSDLDVRAIILNGCSTGDFNKDITTSLAGSLVSANVPIVIGTTRSVSDVSALLFAREFYLAFADGYSIEGSLIEARKRLNIEQFDWSLYALFSNTLEIDSLKLAIDHERSEPN